MRERTRKSIYRVMYDLAKADNTISVGKIDCIRRMCQEYSIDAETCTSALSMTLSEALNEVGRMTIKQGKRLLSLLEQMTMSDGTSSRAEALLLTAIAQELDGSATEKPTFVSVPCGQVDLEGNQVLFIEDGFDWTVNAFIQMHYTHLLHSFRIGGFDFVYMPRVTAQFTSTSQQLLNDIVHYLIPGRSEEENRSIVQAITGLTTEQLYRELLLGKLKFKVELSAPSLLFQLGTTMVNGIKMADYMILRTRENLCDQVDSLVEQFIQRQHIPQLIVNSQVNSPNSLLYTGFYRTLFDLITYQRGAQCELVMHPYSHKNVLTIVTKSGKTISEEPLQIGPKESAFYVFLIRETQTYEGFNIAGLTPADIRYMEEAQQRYEKIYFALCNRDTAPDITDPEIRRPMMSKIKKAIELHPTLVQKMMFMPETTAGKVIKVHVRNIGKTK